jgi:hypothetical protein
MTMTIHFNAPSRSIRRLTAASFFLSGFLAAGGAWAGDAEEAKKLFDKGADELEAGHFDKACPPIAESYRLDPRPGTLFTLAECEAKRGRTATALARYDEYLALYATLPPDKKAKQGNREKDAKAQKAALAADVPELTLALPPSVPAGLVVKRDGEIVAASALGAPMAVDPGDHVIVSQAPGGEPAELRVTIEKKQKKTVTIPVKGAPEAVKAVTPTAPVHSEPTALPPVAPDAGPRKRSLVPVIALGAGAAVGLGVGVAFIAVGGGKSGSAQTESDAIRSSHQSCRAEAANYVGKTRCDALAATLSSADMFRNAAIPALVVGGAALGGALLYVLWPSGKKKAADTGFQAAPILAPGEGGLRLSGSF